MTTEQTLQLAVESLTKVNGTQSRQIEELAARIKELTAQLAYFQRRMFGRAARRISILRASPACSRLQV